MKRTMHIKHALFNSAVIFSSLVFSNGAFAEPPTKSQAMSEEELLTPILKGLVILGNTNRITQHGLEKVSGFHVFDISNMEEIDELRNLIEPQYLNQPLRRKSLAKLKKDLRDFFEQKEKPTQVVLVPGQNLSEGVLHLVVADRHAGELAVADEAFPHFPKPPPPISPPQEQILIPQLNGIVLISNPNDVKHDGIKHLDEMFVVDVNIPGGAEKLLKCIGPDFIGKCLTQSRLIELKKSIINYFRAHKKPVVAIQVPEQDITGGVLQLLVIQGKLGEIRAVGNCWTRSCLLEGYIQLCPGDEIDEAVIIQDLSFMNRNPFRRTDVIYTPGKLPGTTDIELTTEDRRPIRFYMGAENTGVETTDRERLFAGFNWGNVFGLDHVVSYQYTASPDFHKFQAHTIQYSAPTAWRHMVNVFGGASFVHPKIPGARSSGYGVQGSLRYDIPLKPAFCYLHELNLGFDFKRTNNNVEFTEDPVFFGSNVNLTQLVLGYNGSWDRECTKTTFDTELYWSPGKWLSDQSKRAFRSLRAYSKSQYLYGKLELTHIIRSFGDFSISFTGKGQLSNRNLLPSEMFGLGGHDSVRGYDEREYNADNALLLTSELRSPLIHVFNWTNCRFKDELQFLAFIDYGIGGPHKRISKEPGSQYLIGAGPGLRYMIEPFLSARLDWGFKLHHKRSLGKNNSRLHFAVVASF